ncbi:amidohydrolase family protein [Candidatus Micrarchaeota archaeon]|nr:amidohydrolase family protein [Candidatus Micrarchaeota archaeon]
MMPLLIKNATIVTQNRKREVLKGNILIEGGTIASVGKDADTTGQVLDASGKIAMPGLVNTHTHLAMHVFRGYGEDMPLHQWLEERIWPAEAKQTPEEAGISARLGFCEMLRSGTTCFVEMCIHDPNHIFKAAKEAGLRGTIAQGIIDMGDSSGTKELLENAKSVLGYRNGMLHGSVAAHAPHTCSEELLLKTKELARKNKLKYQIHVSETRKEVFEVLKKTGKYPYEYLESIGLMDEDSIFVHGGWLTKREIGLAGKRRISMCACPVSSLKLATGGIAQIKELDSSGASVCLGTDSVASNNSMNMFETMKMAALLQKFHYWKADAIPAQRVLDFATIGGARAAGFDSGAIEAGKPADIVLLEKGPNLRPGHDIVSNLVFSAGPQNVTDVVVNGRLVLQDRHILTLDEPAVMEKANELAGEIMER